MRVAYKPGVRYICHGLTKEFAEPTCAHLDGPSAERAVIQAFFAAIQPAQLDALAALLAQRKEEHAQVERHWAQQRQRVSYEAHLARQRYEAVDPVNRLVAGELERRWEAALVLQRETEEAAQRFQQQAALPALDPKLRCQLEQIAQTLPELWDGGRLSNEHKKLLLRSLITRVILTRTAPDQVEVKIVWVSGHFSVALLTPPIHRQTDVSCYAEMVARIHDLWEQGHNDAAIAAALTAEGYHATRTAHVTPAIVLKIRNRQQWVSNYHKHRMADKIDGLWTVHGLSRELGIDRNWLYRRIYSGDLGAPDVIRKPPYGNYLIRPEPALMARLRQEVQLLQQHRASVQAA